MKKISRIVALLLAVLMLLAVVASSIASAAEEKWEKNVYAYGAGLNESQIEKTADLLGIENLDKVNKIKVSGNDIYKYLNIRRNLSGNNSCHIFNVHINCPGNLFN